MIIGHYTIKTGQRRTYSGRFSEPATFYLECSVTNNDTGKTIEHVTIKAPIREHINNLKFFNWVKA